MSGSSDIIQVNAADIRTEIQGVERSVAAAAARLEESIRRAEEAAAEIQNEAAVPNRPPDAQAELESRLEKARRNATRVRQEGEDALKALRKQSDAAIEKLRRRLKLVEEKLAARH